MKDIKRQSLIEQARELPLPRNFYGGVSDRTLELPFNILSWIERDGTHLNKQDITHHSRHLLIVNLAGTGMVSIDRIPIELTPGSAVMVFPFQFHLYTNMAKRKIEWLYISFDMKDDTGLQPLRGVPVALSQQALSYLQNFLSCWQGRQHNAPRADTQIVLSLASLLNEQLMNVAIPTQHSEQHTADMHDSYELTQRVCNLIYRQLKEPWPLERIAREVGVSDSHLRLVFRRTTGMTLGRYIRETRVKYATGLIASTSLTLSDIAQLTGFDSLFSFSRCFKSCVGISPSAYRTRLRKKTKITRAKPSAG